jgi:hypothetical protein
MKIYPVGTEMFHVGGWADRLDETNSRFSQFCERAKKSGIAHMMT